MSWEHHHYVATCAGCGHEGVCVKSSDDYRSETKYEGFTNEEPDETAVARKRVGARDMRPVCPECGGTEIVIGRLLKSS